MFDVFISYAREDESRAEIFARALEAYGWSVFWDRTIRAGSRFHDVIERELQSACCVLVLWSKDSVKSGWVRDEAGEAMERGVLVPVLINHTPPPLGFRSVHCADLSDWDGAREAQGFQRLISDIKGLIAPSPKQVGEERRWQEAVEGATGARPREERPAEIKPSLGGASDSEEIANLRRRAERGDARAQADLGYKYQNGLDGLPRDEREAARLYKLAAEQGNAAGQANLGML